MILKIILKQLKIISQDPEGKELICECDCERGRSPVLTLETHYKEGLPTIQKGDIFIDGHGRMRS